MYSSIDLFDASNPTHTPYLFVMYLNKMPTFINMAIFCPLSPLFMCKRFGRYSVFSFLQVNDKTSTVKDRVNYLLSILQK